MTAKEHYNKLLAGVYAWMAGDFETKAGDFAAFLDSEGIQPAAPGAIAIDLGAGHGLQSAALARQGYRVRAVDFNRQLLDELAANTQGLPVELIQDDIRRLNLHSEPLPEVIVCWGDTLTHLESADEIYELLRKCCTALAPGGRLLLQFRDYTHELQGTARFIPVKSDENRIMTCFLEYFPGYLLVTDLVYERKPGGWEQQTGTYRKVRLAPDSVRNLLNNCGMQIIFDDIAPGLAALVAVRPAGV